MLWKLVRIKTCLWEKLKANQRSFNEDILKAEKGAKTIQVLHKDLKLAKASRKSVDNSNFLHLDGFEINTGKVQGVTLILVVPPLNKSS